MDIDFLLWLQGIRESIGEFSNTIALLLSKLGSDVLPIAVACVFYWCINKRNGQQLLLGFSLGAFFNGIIKLTCCVYRPWIRNSNIVPVQKAVGEISSYSFPSAHATAASEVYGGIGYFYRKKKALFISMIMLAVLIMLSRNYLGVHTPQDVIVGAIMGVVMICAAGLLLKFVYDNIDNYSDVLTAIIGTVLCVLSLVYITMKSYPADMVNGVLLVDPTKMQQDHFTACGALLGILWGLIWERRAINFEISGSVIVKVIRFITGIAVTLLLYTVVRSWFISFLGGGYGRLVGVFLAMLYVVAVHPLLFSKIEKLLNANKTNF